MILPKEYEKDLGKDIVEVLGLREDIIEVLTTFDWKEYLNCIAMRKIQQFHIVDVLKKNIKGIK